MFDRSGWTITASMQSQKSESASASSGVLSRSSMAENQIQAEALRLSVKGRSPFGERSGPTFRIF